ncbi:hypothetical protein [Halobacterium salinarum]|uniref:hypothetical protein n=1 Tax=Halobacterium salinarum TaxID=2242 RepID=UPI002552C7A6|nr:hypothetical protein [Halobacterium salinarum]MDL0144121.1 hypothetical protein [Halobacterium salinarum]
MNRRKYLKTLAAVPFAPTIPELDKEDFEGEEWNVRGVWRRKDDTGYLAIRDEDREEEFTDYNEWVSQAIRSLNTQHVVNLFDFRLISVYDGDYARSHFAHDNGLEVTIKRDPTEDVEWTAYVTHVAELWDNHREYASTSQIRLAQKLKRERDEYLAD